VRRSRGVALLTAIILVAVAAVIATAIASRSGMDARRGAAVFTVEQSVQLAMGAEALAAYALRDNRQKNPQVVSAAQQSWAQPYGPVEIDHGAVLEAQLEDEAGKFNLNSLVVNGAGGPQGQAQPPGASANPRNGATLFGGGGAAVGAAQVVWVRNPRAFAQFQFLLEELGINTDYAAKLLDWIDSDDQPTYPGGAEDSAYLAQQPPHLTPNMPITSVSELLAMGMDRASYDRLVPFVTALPPNVALNLCTASGEVLDAFAGQRSFSGDPAVLQQQRMQFPCFPDRTAFLAGVGPDQRDAINVGTTTSWFRLRSWITIGTTRFTLYSLIEQDGSGQIRPVLRTYGTE
jgi:general secretion pathway protein K